MYSINDFDIRSKKKSSKILSARQISTNIISSKIGLNFYKNYYNFKNNKLPIIDIKIALSKDNYTKNKKKKWITNEKSRNLVHLLRTKYDAILSSSKSINQDNSLLNCRIKGLENKSPNLIIIDRNLILKKNLRLFKEKKRRKIFIFTISKNKKKINWLKKNNIKVFSFKKMASGEDYKRFFYYY